MEEALKLIEQLAAQLGVAVKELVEAYAARVKYEWIDAIAATMLFMISLPVAVFLTKKGFKRFEEFADDDGLGTVCLVCGMLLLVLAFASGIGIPITISDAVKATGAPTAYAIDQILETIRK